MSDRESLEFDVVVVGGGPAGLSCAIRLRQIAAEAGREISVCVVEKSAAPGGHTLAGAVFETRALDELLPAWRDSESPIQTAAGEDRFLFLTAKRAWKLPTPPSMKNEGNFVVSLGRVVAWLAARAEADGVEIFPGFAAAEILFDDQGAVAGVATGDVGVKKDGSRGANFQRGVELRAKYTVFAEGCRGSLTEDLMRKFDLRRESSPQTYGIGIKELWEVKDENSRPGEILHTVGWPLSAATYGGSFVYHLEPGKVALGFVVGLDYDNPHLSPYDEFQRFKHHPAVAPSLAGGRRIGYGARALNEGGWQSVPKLAVAGGLLVGCAAGFLNVPKIKGAHTAMKSGMLAAEAAAAALAQNRARDLLGRLRASGARIVDRRRIAQSAQHSPRVSARILGGDGIRRDRRVSFARARAVDFFASRRSRAAKKSGAGQAHRLPETGRRFEFFETRKPRLFGRQSRSRSAAAFALDRSGDGGGD